VLAGPCDTFPQVPGSLPLVPPAGCTTTEAHQTSVLQVNSAALQISLTLHRRPPLSACIASYLVAPTLTST
jgi:hypothetical protein